MIESVADNLSTQAPLPGIGTFWYGPQLDCLERACLRSMSAQGHAVTLFVNGKVRGVPSDVEVRDTREIMETSPQVLLKISPSGGSSAALYSDKFRYLMIASTTLIWVDLDVFLLKPLRPVGGYLYAWENNQLINGAVLALPRHSPTLHDLVRFCDNHYPVPPFVSPNHKFRLRMKKIIGAPVHVSLQPWGTWGPLALTWYLRLNREDRHALPSETFYPITYHDLELLMLPNQEIRDGYLQKSVAVHLWGALLRGLIRKKSKIPQNSFLSELLRLGT